MDAYKKCYNTYMEIMENAKRLARVKLEEAQQLLLSYASITKLEGLVPLSQAGERVLFDDITAKLAQPPFDRSPLDGYAVRHEDVANASFEKPVLLRVVQTVYAGQTPTVEIQQGEAVRLTTGTMMPKNATTVIRQENTKESTETVSILVSSKKHENFIFSGEDVCMGELIASRGSRLSSSHIGVLAGQGVFEVRVFRKPKIAVLSTGSELLARGEELVQGKIFDSNQYILSHRVGVLGAIAINTQCTIDEPEALKSKLKEMIAQCDFVITTGGVSVGKHDYMPYVCEKLGGKLLFHGIEMKPGGWAMAFVIEGKVVLCLSGNPFAATATFELLAVPFLKKIAGESQPFHMRAWGILSNSFPKESHGRRFVRGRMEGMNIFIPTNHSSGNIASMVECNCLIDIPAGTPALNAGSVVQAVCLEKTWVNELSKKNSACIPTVIAICGVKNSGKTTLLQHIIPLLKKSGLCVGVLKHDGHDFSPDVPKTDSYKLRKAGASKVAVFSSERYMTIHEKKDMEIGHMLRFFTDTDIILVEGAKNSDLPKIEIVRAEISTKNVCSSKHMLALVTDTPLVLPDVKSVFLNEYNAICNIILEYLTKEKSRQ